MDISRNTFWATVSILIIAFGRTSTGAKLILDHDGGADDAMAIFMALRYEEYFEGPTVLALTTTHGNVDEDQAFINTQRILDVAERREVPIYRGSNSSLVLSVESDHFFCTDGLGNIEHEAIEPIEAQAKHAAVAIVELANQYPGEISLIATGALTNIALAMQLDPSLLSRLSQLYVGAGNVYSELTTYAEFNAEMDVEAYYAVVKNATPDKVTILPFSQLRTTNVTREWREEVLGSIPSTIMEAQNSFETCSIGFSDTWALLDPVVMGAVLNDTIIGDVTYSQNSIILCGEQRGINTNNFTTMEEANVKVINQVLDEEYKVLLLGIFSAELIDPIY